MEVPPSLSCPCPYTPLCFGELQKKMTYINHLIKYPIYPKPGARKCFCKEVDNFGFVEHTISVLTALLCHYKVAIGNI